MTAPDPDYVFGPIVGAHDLDLLLYQIVEYWIETYLHEIERRSGLEPGELKTFRSWRVSHELEKMPEDQVPALIIVNQGIVQNPTKIGTGKAGAGIPGQPYYAIWQYQFGCLLSAKGKKINAAPRANLLAKMYTTAVRLILIQKRGLENPDLRLGMIDWIDEGYDGLNSDDDRTIALHHTDIQVSVPAAAAWATGPLSRDVPTDPIDPDIPTLPQVLTSDVDVEKVDQPDPMPKPDNLGGE